MTAHDEVMRRKSCENHVTYQEIIVPKSGSMNEPK